MCPTGLMLPSYRVEDQGPYVARIDEEPQAQVLQILVFSSYRPPFAIVPNWESDPECAARLGVVVHACNPCTWRSKASEC